MDIAHETIAVCPAPPASAPARPRFEQSELFDPRQALLDADVRNLLAACIVHALHDGYTDGLYAFLPIWQAQFGLSYAGLAAVRALYYGTMGGLQLPADRLLRRFTPAIALVLATVIAAAGFIVMALPLGFAGLCVGLVVAGIGSSIQHPRGSMLVTDTYGAASRRPLGIYNFAGDLGKATLPALHDRGGKSATVGVALALLFIGGAFGKATCTWLSERLGVIGGVMATEAATALLIGLTLFTPLGVMLVVLPLLGIVLNGTSSILYGTVPELAPGGDTGRAFAIFYTSVIGSGGFAPIIYVAVADHSSRGVGIVAAALTAAAIVPLVAALRPALKGSQAASAEQMSRR